jgi:hypothetical protein
MNEKEVKPLSQNRIRLSLHPLGYLFADPDNAGIGRIPWAGVIN